MSNRTYAEKFADFAVGLHFEDLPAVVIEKTKLSIMDNVGCMLAARDDDSVKVVVDLVHSFAP